MIHHLMSRDNVALTGSLIGLVSLLPGWLILKPNRLAAGTSLHLWEGLGMTEARTMDRRHKGKILNKNMRDNKVLTIMDVPTDMTCLPIDLGDTWSITGAKGVGEPPCVPPAGAIANAIYNATGIRLTKTPMGPLKLRA